MSTKKLDLDSVKSVIEHYGLLKPESSVVAAVSGGCDSCVLLDILYRLSLEWKLKITVCHINHNLRGDESDSDEAFVRGLCSKYKIPCRVLNTDVASYGKKHGLSIEDAGRKLRYEFFEKCADDMNEAALIATAHSLSDCEETYIFNSARGASLSGICGIPPKRGRVIRPLIEFSREQIEGYAKLNHIDYVTDSTNLTDEYTRNKIRHSVIPLMKEINPAFDKAFLRLMRNLSQTRDYMDERATALLNEARTAAGYFAVPIANAEPALKARAVAMLLEEMNFTLDNDRTLRICEKLGEDFKEELSKNCYIVSKNSFITKTEKEKEDFEIEEKAFSEGKILLNDEKTAKISLLSQEEFKNSYNVKEIVLKDTFDFDKIVGKAVLRKRKEGDRADVHGGTKTLKKLFIEEKIPKEKRNSILVIADDRGVIWIEGFGADKRARLDEGTKTAVAVKIVNTKKGERQ